MKIYRRVVSSLDQRTNNIVELIKKIKNRLNGIVVAIHTIGKSKSETLIDKLAYCNRHCLHLAICFFQNDEISKLKPKISSFYNELVQENMCSVDEENKMLAVRALMLIGIDIANQNLEILLTMIRIDNSKMVVIEAFLAVIKIYISNFSLKRSVNLNRCKQMNTTDDSTKILSLMAVLLDRNDPEICALGVDEFYKLFMSGHIKSAELFSKLFIMYHSPMTEAQLKNTLSEFLTKFSFSSNSNQLCVEESFMLTIKCLMNAQPDSYLSKIDLIKASKLLFYLTNPRNLSKTIQTVFI